MCCSPGNRLEKKQLNLCRTFSSSSFYQLARTKEWVSSLLCDTRNKFLHVQTWQASALEYPEETMTSYFCLYQMLEHFVQLSGVSVPCSGSLSAKAAPRRTRAELHKLPAGWASAPL